MAPEAVRRFSFTLQFSNYPHNIEAIVEGKPTILLRDRDTKFSASFDEVFTGEGTAIQPTQFRSPNLNAHCERWIQSCKQECLEHFVVFGETHLDYLVQEYVRYFNEERPHSCRPLLVAEPPSGNNKISVDEVECSTRLGGLLRSFRRAA